MQSCCTRYSALLSLLTFLLVSCGSPVPRSGDGLTYFTGATILVDPARPAIENAVLAVREGRVERITSGTSALPEGAAVVDLRGKYVIPGLISAHVHVSDVNGMGPRAYTKENTLRQLDLFARYGITTVLSLGGEKQPAFALRDEQESPALHRARLFLAGDVITAGTPKEAREKVTAEAARRADWIKIRVDDNLGTSAKMSPEIYSAVIDEAHARGLRVAVHIFYLDDAKDVLRAGADMIAHSVRDKEIDDEFVTLMRARDIPYCPTLTRELSTFVYSAKPAFFDDPFFQKEADPAVVASLLEPESQKKFADSKSAAGYKAALEVATRNLKRASDAGLLVVMGTDAGPFPERFQGYFEHLEMEMMAEAGLTPKQVLESATTLAARALAKPELGSLQPGSWADFVVLDKNPLEDIRNTKTIAEVRIAGNRVQEKQKASRGTASSPKAR